MPPPLFRSNYHYQTDVLLRNDRRIDSAPSTPDHPRMKQLLLAVLTLLAACLVSCGSGASSSETLPPDGGLPNAATSDAGGLPDASTSDAEGLPDGATSDDGGLPDAGVDPPQRVFFIGNSFTLQGPIPDIVDQLAVAAGFPDPTIEFRAVGGQSLTFHRNDDSAEGAVAKVEEGWDVVVLQDFSTRPTDAGDPAAFKDDATYFHDLARTANPEARVILYETWARRFNHPIYPGTYDDPADMQAQLRTHYIDAAESYIPANTTLAPNVVVAPVGDAWETQLASGEPPKLHGDDDYHAGPVGQYLNALVSYATIYGTKTVGLPPIGVSPDVAATLQAVADATTGNTADYPGTGPPAFPVGETAQVDFGSLAAPFWPQVTVNGASQPLVTTRNSTTTAVVSTFGFGGDQTGGLATNDLNWPDNVTADTIWVGSFDSHAAALAQQGTVRLGGLPDGSYDVRIFASRTGDDNGNGRLTRYTIGDQTRDLDAQDNTANLVEFLVETGGTIDLQVAVSPAGSARFGYIGALEITRR